MQELTIGAAAPDVALADEAGETVRLADLWQTQPIVLLFLRHFG